MADALFKRRCAATVIPPALKGDKSETQAGFTVSDLRMSFKVKKTLKKDPNTCELNITNLSAQTRAKMGTKGAKIILQAGYAGFDGSNGTVGQIFSGDARTIDQVREGPDWVTKIQCGDGERAYQFVQVSESFKPGTKVSVVLSTIIQLMAKEMKIDPGDSLKRVSKIQGNLDMFIHGYAAVGKASRELDKVLSAVGLSYSIQDGKLQILGDADPTLEPAVFLSPDSGLIGSPAYCTPKKEGKKAKAVLKLKSLLQPTLKPGRTVVIESEGRKGQFRIEQLMHTGDTAGGDWFTELEVQPI